MTTKTTDAATPVADAPLVPSPGPAQDISKPDPDGLPGWVLDAVELPALTGWRPETAGDFVAGALISTTERTVPRLNGTGDRSIAVALIYGITFSAAEGAVDGPHYLELAGFPEVLDRHLRRLAQHEPSTLLRVTYLGHRPSPTKGHNDYADFELAVGRRDDNVPLDVLVNAPELQAAIPAAADEGEPF